MDLEIAEARDTKKPAEKKGVEQPLLEKHPVETPPVEKPPVEKTGGERPPLDSAIPKRPVGRPKSGDGVKSPPSAALRPRAGTRVSPDEAADPYAMLDRLHQDMVKTVQRIRREHPESTISTPVHPKEITRPLDVPILAGDLTGSFLMGAATALANKAGASYRPNPKDCEKAGALISDASKYWGVDMTPRSQATWAAVTALISIFFPILVELIFKFMSGAGASSAPALPAPATPEPPRPPAVMPLAEA